MKENRVNRMKNKKIKIISKTVWTISALVLVFFIYQLINSNIIPTKYLVVIISVLVVLKLLFFLFAFKFKTKKVVLIIFSIIAVLLMLLELFAGLKIRETINFLNKNLNLKYDTNVYYVVVNSKSKYKELSDIKGQEVESYNDLDDIKVLEKAINKKVKVNIKYSDNIVELLKSVIDDDKKIILVNSGNYDVMIENDETYEKNTKILGNIEIKTKKERTDSNIDVTEDPFIVYLSGIDTRSGGMPARSLSDVNMYIVVNPNVKKILLVHIPRDYYVQLAGTTGMKDKLTHAGSLGGINMSMDTIENFMGYKANYYVRVNFNAVIKLVDAIGGITLFNDQNKSFTCWTDRSCTFKPGNNYVDGRCALAFARERKAYQTGDKHRGENQEQVIGKIFEKITSSSSIISNYSNILNSLNGTIETSLSTDDITKLVKFQLDDMSSWEVETANLNGTSTMAETYSSPGQKLSIMLVDEESVSEAKEKIKVLLEEE